MIDADWSNNVTIYNIDGCVNICYHVSGPKLLYYMSDLFMHQLLI